MDSDTLFFDAFEATGSSEWITAIERELATGKGIGSISWEPEPGLVVKPFYHNTGENFGTEFLPGEHEDWLICDRLFDASASQLTADLADSVAGGAGLLELVNPDPTELVQFLENTVDTLPEMMVRCDGVLFDTLIRSGVAAPNFGKNTISLLCDPMVDQKSEVNGLDHFNHIAGQMDQSTSPRSSSRVGCVDGAWYRKKGAGVVSTVAYVLSGLSEWCNTLAGISKASLEAARGLTIIIPVADLFMLEIAGLRALRLLVPQILQTYGVPGPSNVMPRIHAVTEPDEAANSDRSSLLVRASSQAVSAVLGGADTVAVSFRRSESGAGAREDRRLARNLLLLLKHEALLNRVANPLAGSHFVENVTNQVADAAWDKFREIEKYGGLLLAERNGALDEWLSNEQVALRSHIHGAS